MSGADEEAVVRIQSYVRGLLARRSVRSLRSLDAAEDGAAAAVGGGTAIALGGDVGHPDMDDTEVSYEEHENAQDSSNYNDEDDLEKNGSGSSSDSDSEESDSGLQAGGWGVFKGAAVTVGATMVGKLLSGGGGATDVVDEDDVIAGALFINHGGLGGGGGGGGAGAGAGATSQQ